MTRISFAVTLLLSVYISQGQVFKIQAGTSLSSLDWNIITNNYKIPGNRIVGQSIFFGFDYAEKRSFNLSRNIGSIRKGSRQKGFIIDSFGNVIERKNIPFALDYLTLNTTLDLKYPIKDKVVPFISIGPRIDYIISTSDNFKALKDMDELNMFSCGINLGIGIKYQFSRFQIGMRGDYLYNFNKISDYYNPIDLTGLKVSDNTFLLNTFLGYRLK